VEFLKQDTLWRFPVNWSVILTKIPHCCWRIRRIIFYYAITTHLMFSLLL